MTGWADPHSMATRKERHMGCHCHRHRRRLIPSSNIGEGWWRCRVRRHLEGGQVRWYTTNVNVRPIGVRNAWTHQRQRRGIPSRAGPPPRSHQIRQPSHFVLVTAHLHHAAAVQRSFADTFSKTPEIETVFLWLCRDRRHHWVFCFQFAFDLRSIFAVFILLNKY